MCLSAEVIFPVGSSDDHNPCIFRYDIGPTALKATKKRGRPKAENKRQVSQRISKIPAFEFIHIDGHSGIPDANSRKMIRRRVMINHLHQRKKNGERQALSPGLSPQIAGVDPFNTLPIRFEPYAHDLLKYYITTGWQKYYYIEKHTSFNPITEYWISLVLTDDAFLHTIIGCADLHFSPSKAPQASLTTIRHLNAAISIVNKRIANREIPTDATLVIVATMALMEKHRGSHENWDIHMKGLQKLVALRGGLVSLESQPLAMGKLYRADLAGSIDAAQEPYFSSRGLSTPMKSDPQFLNSGFQMLDSLNTLDGTLVSCIQNAADIMSSLKNLSIKSPHTEAARIRYFSTALQYTLLSVKYSDPIHEICRLSLLLLSEMLVNQSSWLFHKYEMLIAKIWDIYDASTTHLFVPELKLWVFIIVASCTISEKTRKNSLCVVSEAALALDVSTIKEAESVLKTFLWDSALETDTYKAAWDTLPSR
ncbi:hypothetical protein N7451_011853 [Penicillium sp. IBT 35674x]|nr:hypothetical protein N7451_011853 [Penicillium sp. IBT 35674x]